MGCVVLITTNTLIFGFVNWLPTFFGQQGISITKSLAYTLVLAARLAGRMRRRRRSPPTVSAASRPIIGASVFTHRLRRDLSLHGRAVAAADVGFFLIVGIYVLTAVLYGVYTTELFPTEVRLRANGICNMLGRGATIVTPFIILALFKDYGVGGVLGSDDRTSDGADHRGRGLGHRDEPARPRGAGIRGGQLERRAAPGARVGTVTGPQSKKNSLPSQHHAM